MNIMLGSDAEIFLKKDGELVSAYGVIEGTKSCPFQVKNGAAWQVDGMAAELNPPPSSTEEEWLFSIQDVMAQLKASIPDYELAIQPVAEFGKEFIAAQPDEAIELGCEADYNAWLSKRNEAPESDSFRTGAGHVHIGWTTNQDPEANRSMGEQLVKQLDFFLGLPSLLFDTDEKRRSLYGKAGAYRVKPYGVEYRTLSNQWLTSPSLMSLIFNNTKAAVDSLMTGTNLWEEHGDIQHIINRSMKTEAIGIMESAGICYE